jgi:protein involved in polysaccharide export with SLBB domain
MNRSILVGLVVLGILVTGQIASAQTNITPEQIRMFQSLPPAQQQMLLRQFGIDPGSMSMMMSLPPSEEQGSIDSFDTELPFLEFEEEQEEELRIEGGDSIVVTTKLKEDIDPADARAFMADINRSRFLGSLFFELDKRGALALKGIDPIPLAGLSAEEVAIRLGSEPLLSALDIEVTILPLTPMGEDALEPFGYRLFGDYEERRRLREQILGAFEEMPTDAIPVPRDYVLGPGDVLTVQLYGNENTTVSLPVNRDGTINFPKLGPRPVAGLTFGELKDEIEQRIDEQLIGTEAAVTLGELRSIRVFVVGDVKRPGAFTVSSLARITNALFYAGGITEIGSLRRIQLKRDGELVETLDLYDLLLRGDTRNDAQLRANDVVFVPPVEFQVAIDGEIKRPAIYELRTERTLEQVVRLAGGLSAAADATAVQLKRVSQRGTREIETLDVLTSSGAGMVVQPGDFVMIYPVIEELDDAVYLSGHTSRPGMYEWEPGMRLVDLIPTDNYLLPKADLGYVLIRRETGSDRRTAVLSTDLREARAAPASAANLPLQPRDRVTLFELGIARSAAMARILEELQVQATRQESFRMVQVGGNVAAPGQYPLEDGMRVSDLLRAGGGLDASAYMAEAEMRRFVINGSGGRETQLLSIDLSAVEAGDAEADLLLTPYDYVNIKEVPEWEKQFTVEIVGEVRFPGRYPVRRGEMLSSIVARAGGLTESAFPEGSVFTRDSLREREANQLKQFERRLESDLAALGLRAAADPSGNAQQAMSVGQSLLEQIRSTEPTGRLVIELDRLVGANNPEAFDIALRHGDKLYVPQRSQEIMVLGEVQYSTSHLFAAGRNRDDYIGLSGGLTSNADAKRIYVVRANGAVHGTSRSRWFRGGGGQVNPGDSIVVPIKTDRVPTIVQWASITQILYNLAISVAAVNSF